MSLFEKILFLMSEKGLIDVTYDTNMNTEYMSEKPYSMSYDSDYFRSILSHNVCKYTTTIKTRYSFKHGPIIKEYTSVLTRDSMEMRCVIDYLEVVSDNLDSVWVKLDKPIIFKSCHYLESPPNLFKNEFRECLNHFKIEVANIAYDNRKKLSKLPKYENADLVLDRICNKCGGVIFKDDERYKPIFKCPKCGEIKFNETRVVSSETVKEIYFTTL